jgi:ribonuclease T1
MRDLARSSAFRGILALVVSTVLLAILMGCAGGTSGATPATGATEVPITTWAATDRGFASKPPADWAGGTIDVDELPIEAIETLASIAVDGPYPYDQDGSTFQNREGRLPARAQGFYREYTVETRGSPDRGARRFVVGNDTFAYYTDDHYGSFRFVVP